MDYDQGITKNNQSEKLFSLKKKKNDIKQMEMIHTHTYTRARSKYAKWQYPMGIKWSNRINDIMQIGLMIMKLMKIN